MFEMLKKGGLVSLGLAALTKEKVQNLVNKMIRECNLSEQEGKTLVQELTRECDNARKCVEKAIEEYTHKSFTRLSIASQEDLQKLERRIRKLEETSIRTENKA